MEGSWTQRLKSDGRNSPAQNSYPLGCRAVGIGSEWEIREEYCEETDLLGAAREGESATIHEETGDWLGDVVADVGMGNGGETG